MKTCSRCRLTKEAKDFNRDKNTADGLTCQCRDCRRTWRQENRDRERAKNARYYAANRTEQIARVKAYGPEKKKAHLLLRDAVRKGEVLKPKTCNICGSYGPVDGHHFDYAKPLAVTWVCRACHKALHFMDQWGETPQDIGKIVSRINETRLNDIKALHEYMKSNTS